MFTYSLAEITSAESYVAFIEKFQSSLKTKTNVLFGGQVEGRVGAPVCLAFSGTTDHPTLQTDMAELVNFCLHSGNGLEISDGKDHSIAIPYGLILSHMLYRDCLYRPCQVPDAFEVSPEDYVMNPISDLTLPPPARHMLSRVIKQFAPDIEPKAMTFEGRDPVQFQGIVFNVYRDQLASEQAQHLEGLLRWYMPPSVLVRLYNRSDDLVSELETAKVLNPA